MFQVTDGGDLGIVPPPLLNPALPLSPHPLPFPLHDSIYASPKFFRSQIATVALVIPPMEDQIGRDVVQIMVAKIRVQIMVAFARVS